ncbi:Glutathione S-transferase-like protein gedE [Fusarium oxysporum f. sp. albedinis]|nr:Glutathione S-transferase-like protein gedE [Fusarium oxysporum f. sp. albedinis]
MNGYLYATCSNIKSYLLLTFNHQDFIIIPIPSFFFPQSYALHFQIVRSAMSSISPILRTPPPKMALSLKYQCIQCVV